MLYTKSDLSNSAGLLQRALTNRDADRVTALFAETAWALYPLPEPCLGREAIRQLWHSLFETTDLCYSITFDEVVESEQGDLGYTAGRWWLVQSIVGVHQGGRYVAIWQPNHGAWEITHLMAHIHDDVSSEGPPPDVRGVASGSSNHQLPGDYLSGK